MVTNNYWQYLYYVSQNVPGSGSTSYGDFTMIEGFHRIYSYTNPMIFRTALTQIRKNLYGAVGTGDTTPAKTDTDLASRLTTNDGLRSLTTTVNISYDENGLKTIVTITGINNTGVSVTIKEAGVYGWSGNYDGFNNPTGFILYARTLLDTPITVPNGQGFSVSVEWNET